MSAVVTMQRVQQRDVITTGLWLKLETALI